MVRMGATIPQRVTRVLLGSINPRIVKTPAWVALLGSTKIQLARRAVMRLPPTPPHQPPPTARHPLPPRSPQQLPPTCLLFILAMAAITIVGPIPTALRVKGTSFLVHVAKAMSLVTVTLVWGPVRPRRAPLLPPPAHPALLPPTAPLLRPLTTLHQPPPTALHRLPPRYLRLRPS
jgi:hypothetical protein